MIIQHNLLAMYTSLNVSIAGNNKSKSSEKLSSGYRINRAADDAAGLSISEKMRYQIRGLNRSGENIQDGISYCNVADGALGEVNSMLDRIKELSVQSANDSNTDSDRQAIDSEVQELKEQINSIFKDTSFNSQKIWQAAYVPDAGGICKDFSLYNVSDSNGTYDGGIIYMNHRYSWSDLGVSNWDASTGTFTSTASFMINANILHNDGLNSDNDSSSAKDDYISGNNSGALFTIQTTAGNPSCDIQKSYSWSADNAGIYIDNVLVNSSDPTIGNTTWAAMGLTAGQHVDEGTYSFTYYGMEVSFDVPKGGDDWDDFLGGINNPLLHLNWHSEYFSQNSQETAYLAASTRDILIDDTNKDYISDDPYAYTVRADADGIWLTNSSSAVSPLTKSGANADLIRWEDLKNDDNDSITSWGLDTNGDGTTNKNAPANTEGGDQAVTLYWDTPYTYSNSYLGAGASLFGLDFKIDETASLSAAIADIDNSTYSNLGITSPVTISSYVPGTGDFQSSGVSASLSFLTQRDELNRTFSSYTESIANGTISQSGDTYVMTLAGTNGGSYALTSTTTPSSLKAMLTSAITSSMTSLYNNVKTDPSKVANLSSNATQLGLSSYQLTFQNGDDSVRLSLDLSNVNYSDIISSADYASSSETPASSDFAARVAAYVGNNLNDFLGSSLSISANGATDQSLSLNQNSVTEKVVTNVPIVDGYDLGLKIQAGAFANDSIDIKYEYLRNGSLGIKTLNTLTSESSSAAIAQVDSAIDKVSTQRALFGAYTNRLNSAYSNNCNTSENLQSAESLLRDTDIAKEMVSYGKHSIIEQAGQSMLAQANQISNGVLTLLKG